MSFNLSKKSILKKTVQVSLLTFLSRIFGIIREFLMVRYFGVGALFDAFITSFRIPNFFRHIFAEGALSASFIPVFVKAVKQDNREEANGLMSISFLFFEGIVLLMYAFVLFKTEWVVRLLAPGFSAEQIGYAIPFLRILFSFLLVASSSALLAGALNSVNHFFVPAFGTPLWNMIYIITLLLCLSFKLPPTYLCFGIILGGFIQFLLHLFVFFKYNFTFGKIDAGAIAAFKSVLAKFLPCLFGVSIVELNLFVSGIIASFLPEGSISLLYLGSRFMNIPLGMFAVALSNIMLPHFSRLVLYAPKRLNFYLLEVAKFVTWVILPAMLFLMFVAKPLFMLLLGAKATPLLLHRGSLILMLYSSGLLFLCLNKILLSMFYALKDTWATTIASGVCAAINIIGDILSIRWFGAYGIGAANTVAAIVMTIMCLYLLLTRHNVVFYLRSYAVFALRYFVQLSLAVLAFYASFTMLQNSLLATSWAYLFAPGMVGYWALSFSLAGACMFMMFLTHRMFGIDIYFLKK